MRDNDYENHDREDYEGLKEGLHSTMRMGNCTATLADRPEAVSLTPMVYFRAGRALSARGGCSLNEGAGRPDVAARLQVFPDSTRTRTKGKKARDMV